MQPTISVIIPAYNAAAYIGEAIQSVLDQTFSDFELIVVDDGSTDDTAAVVKGFTDSRIHYHHQANAGVANARNVGIGKVEGVFVAFLDADDLFLPANLEKKLYFLKGNPAISLVHSSEIKFDSTTGKIMNIVQGTEGNVLEKLLCMGEHVIHSPSSVVVRKELLNRIGGFDPKLSTSADWDMWVRMAVKTWFGYIQEPLVKYRIHPSQMHNNIRLMDRDMHYAMHKHYREGIFCSLDQYRYCLANLRLVLSACYLGDAKDISSSLKYLLLSLSGNPRPAINYLLAKLKLR